MPTDDRIDATLSPADRDAVMAAIQTIRAKLPFLIDLTPEERRGLPKMGDQSRTFVSRALEVATQDDSFLPRSFDVAEMRKDVDLVNALEPIRIALARLAEGVDDTLTRAGSEAYSAGLVVYQAARANGRGGALDTVADELGRRFARKAAADTGGGATAPAKP